MTENRNEVNSGLPIQKKWTKASSRSLEAAAGDSNGSNCDVVDGNHIGPVGKIGKNEHENYEINVLEAFDDESIDLLEEFRDDQESSGDGNSLSPNGSVKTIASPGEYNTDGSNGNLYRKPEDDTLTETFFSKEEMESFGYLLNKLEASGNESGQQIAESNASTNAGDATEGFELFRVQSKSYNAGSNFPTSHNFDEYAVLTESETDSDLGFKANTGKRQKIDFNFKKRFNLFRDLFGKSRKKVKKNKLIDDVKDKDTAANFSTNIETETERETKTETSELEDEGEDNSPTGQDNNQEDGQEGGEAQEQNSNQDSAQLQTVPIIKKVHWRLLSEDNLLCPTDGELNGQRTKKKPRLKILLPSKKVPDPEKTIMKHKSRYERKKKTKDSEGSDLINQEEFSDAETLRLTKEMTTDDDFDEVMDLRINMAQYHRNHNATTFSKRGVMKKQELLLRRQNGLETQLQFEQRVNDLAIQNETLEPKEAAEGYFEVSSESSDESSNTQKNKENVKSHPQPVHQPQVRYQSQNQPQSLDQIYDFSRGYILPLPAHPVAQYYQQLYNNSQSPPSNGRGRPMNPPRRRPSPKHNHMGMVFNPPADGVAERNNEQT